MNPTSGAVVAQPALGAGLTLALLGVGVLAAGLTLDPAGRLLAVPAGVAVLALGLRDCIARPVLCADVDGLTVRLLLGAERLTWAEVVRVRAVRERRADLLEVDTGDRVLLLSRRRLGRRPAEVADELNRLRPLH